MDFGYEERLKQKGIKGEAKEEIKEEILSQPVAGPAPEPLALGEGPRKIRKIPLKQVVFIAGILVVILVVISFAVNAGAFTSKRISEKQLIIGAALTMEENKSLKFNLGEEKHEIEIEKVGNNWVELVVRSDPIRVRLKVNEVAEVDVNFDGQSDIRIKLFRIEEGKAIIAVKRINKDACIEDWVCEQWTNCEGDRRTRTCEDANECRSLFYKPVLEQKCVGSMLATNRGSEDSEEEKIPQLNFTFSECNSSIDIFKRSNFGVKESAWVNSTFLRVKALASIECSSIIGEGGFGILNDKIVLSYKVYSIEGRQSDCYCAHELIYEFTNLEEGEYGFGLNEIPIVESLVNDFDAFWGENITDNLDNKEDVLAGDNLEEKKNCFEGEVWSTINESCVPLSGDIFIAKILEIMDSKIYILFGEDIVAEYEINSSLLEGISEGDTIEARYIGEDILSGGRILEISILNHSLYDLNGDFN